MNVPDASPAVDAPMGRVEFVALMAMLVATVAFSIDVMLPALPRIGAELTPEALNRAQLIVASILLWLGSGTFLTDPLSDSFGHEPGTLVGAAVGSVLLRCRGGALVRRHAVSAPAGRPGLRDGRTAAEASTGGDAAFQRVTVGIFSVYCRIPSFQASEDRL